MKLMSRVVLIYKATALRLSICSQQSVTCNTLAYVFMSFQQSTQCLACINYHILQKHY